MFDCNTLVCVQNQMPDVGMDDLLIVGFLAVTVVVTVCLILEAWKDD